MKRIVTFTSAVGLAVLLWGGLKVGQAVERGGGPGPGPFPPPFGCCQCITRTTSGPVLTCFQITEDTPPCDSDDPSQKCQSRVGICQEDGICEPIGRGPAR